MANTSDAAIAPEASPWPEVTPSLPPALTPPTTGWAPGAEPPSKPASGLSAFGLAAADIKLAHSIFALPFAIFGAFLARADGPTDTTLQPSTALPAKPQPDPTSWTTFAGQLGIIVLCMVCARTWAMMINRIADRDIDAANQRTRRRAVASGRLSLPMAWTITLLAAAAFVGGTSLFGFIYQNWWPLWLSGPVLGWIALYSFTKRFTAACHLFLGAALAISPVAAAIAIRPESIFSTPSLWWLAAFVLLWVAGFDVIYALQDLEFDREKGLFSIPAVVGEVGAIWFARLLHAFAFVMLLAAWTSHALLGHLFAIGLGLVAALLILEHVILARRGRAGIPMAFFTVNGIVSLALGTCGVVDLLR
jgi:4-hydroxybenzoate polyprenyltransferase